MRMLPRTVFRFSAAVAAVVLALPALLSAQQQDSQSSSSSPQPASSQAAFAHEKAPALLDPAGPDISLVSSETLFVMAAALNACGYDEGLAESDPIRQKLRDQVAQALAASEDARGKRDKLCLFVAQHRLTGSEKDISQYISLALYLSPPPEMETSVELTEMPPDSTQVVEILPLLRDFAAAVDLHGIWLLTHHYYDEVVNHLHQPLTNAIVSVNYYVKMPASAYDGRRFLVVVEPQLSPRTVNARVYGTEYVVVTSPVHGEIRMTDVRHTYLHYVLEPLLFSRSNSIDRFVPILKEVRDAPLEFRYRSDITELTTECLIKAIEARTMDTGIKPYVAPPNETREDAPRIETERNKVLAQMEGVRRATVRHDMTQGFVLTDYFYRILPAFEKDPASIKDTIGEMVYSMDVDHEVHAARNVEFDKQADGDVLERSAPRRLTGLDLAEAKLAANDLTSAAALAQQALADPAQTDAGRAEFILARTEILKGKPEEAMAGFQKAATTAKETRIQAWSHIYLGRMNDLLCKRDDAVSEYQAALAVRDGQQDTRLAAERGVKAAYAVRGHSCDADGPDGDDAKPGAAGAAPSGSASASPNSPNFR